MITQSNYYRNSSEVPKYPIILFVRLLKSGKYVLMMVNIHFI